MCITEAWTYRDCGCRYDCVIPCVNALTSSLGDLEEEDESRTVNHLKGDSSSSSSEPGESRLKETGESSLPSLPWLVGKSLLSTRSSWDDSKTKRTEDKIGICDLNDVVYKEFLEPVCDDCLVEEVVPIPKEDSEEDVRKRKTSEDTKSFRHSRGKSLGSKLPRDKTHTERLIWESNVEVSIDPEPQTEPGPRQDWTNLPDVGELETIPELPSIPECSSGTNSNSASPHCHYRDPSSGDQSTAHTNSTQATSDFDNDGLPEKSWYDDHDSDLDENPEDASDADDERSSSRVGRQSHASDQAEKRSNTQLSERTFDDTLPRNAGRKVRPTRSADLYLLCRAGLEPDREDLTTRCTSRSLGRGQTRPRLELTAIKETMFDKFEHMDRDFNWQREEVPESVPIRHFSQHLDVLAEPELLDRGRTLTRSKRKVSAWAKSVVGMVSKSLERKSEGIRRKARGTFCGEKSGWTTGQVEDIPDDAEVKTWKTPMHHRHPSTATGVSRGIVASRYPSLDCTIRVELSAERPSEMVEDDLPEETESLGECPEAAFTASTGWEDHLRQELGRPTSLYLDSSSHSSPEAHVPLRNSLLPQDAHSRQNPSTPSPQKYDRVIRRHGNSQASSAKYPCSESSSEFYQSPHSVISIDNRPMSAAIATDAFNRPTSQSQSPSPLRPVLWKKSSFSRLRSAFTTPSSSASNSHSHSSHPHANTYTSTSAITTDATHDFSAAAPTPTVPTVPDIPTRFSSHKFSSLPPLLSSTDYNFNTRLASLPPLPPFGHEFETSPVSTRRSSRGRSLTRRMPLTSVEVDFAPAMMRGVEKLKDLDVLLAETLAEKGIKKQRRKETTMMGRRSGVGAGGVGWVDFGVAADSIDDEADNDDYNNDIDHAAAEQAWKKF